MRGKVFRIVLLFVIIDVLVFFIASELITQRLVSQDKVNGITLKVWQGTGWFLRPTRYGGIVKSLPDIVGCDSTKYYFVLLQNRYELRASGGLMGSYARIKFENCGLNEIKVEDIYVPDGQIPGHVEPPSPIQEAFQQGWYKLRDANWEIDFTKSAQVISWFFEKGNEVKPDGVIALNFDLVLDLLKKVGPLYLLDFKQEITPDNFYETVQVKVEEGFFPGSTQKRDYLRALETVFMDKIKGASVFSKVQLARIVLDHLNRGEILAYSANTQTQKFIEASGWSGKLDYTKHTGLLPICSDYFYSVESNLGANKANRFIERAITLDIRKDEDRLNRKVTITLNNRSPVTSSEENPLLSGGTYVDYHRVVIPIGVDQVTVLVNGQILPTEKITQRNFSDLNLAEIGFWITVPRGKEIKTEIEYITGGQSIPCLYRLDYQRQPGTGEYGVVANSNGKSFFKDDIDRGKVLYRWLK